MNIKELFLRNKIEEILPKYQETYFSLDNFNLIKTKCELQKELKDITDFYKKMCEHEIIETNCVIFGVKFLKSEITLERNNNENYIETFFCKKEEIENKIKKEFTLWNNVLNNRIEHYCYNDINRAKILGTEVFFDRQEISEQEILCAIINQMIWFGIEDKESEKNIKNFIKRIDCAISESENYLEKETMNADDFFKKIKERIYENSDEFERKKMIDLEYLRNLTNNILFKDISNRINHHKSILTIEQYYLEKLKSK